MFDATGIVHAPERQCIGPLARPMFHDFAGEVEVRWRLHEHALKSNFSLQFANAQLAKTG